VVLQLQCTESLIEEGVTVQGLLDQITEPINLIFGVILFLAIISINISPDIKLSRR
jgi:hypothetical protein